MQINFLSEKKHKIQIFFRITKHILTKKISQKHIFK